MAFYSTAPTKRAACSAIGSPYLGARLIQKKQGWNLGRFSWLGHYSVTAPAPAPADVAMVPLRLSRLAVTCARQAPAWRGGHRPTADKR